MPNSVPPQAVSQPVQYISTSSSSYFQQPSYTGAWPGGGDKGECPSLRQVCKHWNMYQVVISRKTSNFSLGRGNTSRPVSNMERDPPTPHSPWPSPVPRTLSYAHGRRLYNLLLETAIQVRHENECSQHAILVLTSVTLTLTLTLTSHYEQLNVQCK